MTGVDNLRDAAWKLAHDVGKYASRTARNLPGDKISSGIAKLLYEDLFETKDTKSALMLFEELAKPLEENVKGDKLLRCRRFLVEIDGLREKIKESDDASIRYAAALAIEMDSLLRAIAVEMDEASS